MQPCLTGFSTAGIEPTTQGRRIAVLRNGHHYGTCPWSIGWADRKNKRHCAPAPWQRPPPPPRAAPRRPRLHPQTHDPAPGVSGAGAGGLLRPQRLASAGGGTPLVQHGVAARGWGHEDPVAVLDHLLDIVEGGVEPAVRHMVRLADVQDLLDAFQYVRMVVLTWVAQLLGEVALA